MPKKAKLQRSGKRERVIKEKVFIQSEKLERKAGGRVEWNRERGVEVFTWKCIKLDIITPIQTTKKTRFQRAPRYRRGTFWVTHLNRGEFLSWLLRLVIFHAFLVSATVYSSSSCIILIVCCYRVWISCSSSQNGCSVVRYKFFYFIYQSTKTPIVNCQFPFRLLSLFCPFFF